MELGQKLTVNNKLVRRCDYTRNRKDEKFWNAKSCKKEVIFLGFRTLANGLRDYHYEEGCSFIPNQSFRAALVCENVNENPFYTILDLPDVTEPNGFDTRKLDS